MKSYSVNLNLVGRDNVTSVHLVQVVIGELIDLLAFAEFGAVGKTIRGDDRFVHVSVKIF